MQWLITLILFISVQLPAAFGKLITVVIHGHRFLMNNPRRILVLLLFSKAILTLYGWVPAKVIPVIHSILVKASLKAWMPVKHGNVWDLRKQKISTVSSLTLKIRISFMLLQSEIPFQYIRKEVYIKPPMAEIPGTSFYILMIQRVVLNWSWILPIPIN